MFSRIKGVIDSQIAAEQARTRNSQTRSPSLTRPSSRATRTGSRNTTSNQHEQEKEPSEFESECESPIAVSLTSRSGTPVAIEAVTNDPLGAITSDGDSNTTKDSVTHTLSNGTTKFSTNLDLPSEVRVKMRKLEKIEGKYAELLRSYKIVHARSSLIEPFEKALRENTPCESISDIKTLVDYINSFSLHADLAKTEIIRVAKERDDYKAQAQLAQRQLESKDRELLEMKMSISEVQVAGPVTTKDGAFLLPKNSDDIFNFDDEQEGLGVQVESLRNELESVNSHLKILDQQKKVAEEAVQGIQKIVEVSQIELESLRETCATKDSEIEGLERKINSSNEKVQTLTSSAAEDYKNVHEMRAEMQKRVCLVEKNLAQSIIREKQTENQKGKLEIKIEKLLEESIEAAELRKTIHSKQEELSKLNQKMNLAIDEISKLEASLENFGKLQLAHSSLQRTVANLEGQIKERKSTEGTQLSKSYNTVDIQLEKTVPLNGGSGGRKRNKKKKKGKANPIVIDATECLPGKESEVVEDENQDIPTTLLHSSESIISDLQTETEKLRDEITQKEARIATLSAKSVDIDALNDEIESLRDDLVNLGEEHVEAKDKLKTQAKELWGTKTQSDQLKSKVQALEAKICQLEEHHATLLTETNEAYKTFQSQVETMKKSSSTLEADLLAAQQLAVSRFKDLSELRVVLQKVQPELLSLQTENANLATVNTGLNSKIADLKRLEQTEQDLKNDIRVLEKKVRTQDNEISSLKKKCNDDSSKRLMSEEQVNLLQQELVKVQDSRRQIIESRDQVNSDLSNCQKEAFKLKSVISSFEAEVKTLKTQRDDLEDDLELRTAQVESTQNLMNSMRDQSNELTMQSKEAQDQREFAEDEITELQRLLAERTREAETMRRLLNEVEIRNETRVADMRQRIEAAIEERDKAEEEVTVIGRSRAKEVGDIRDRFRDAERGLKLSEEARERVESEVLGLREAKHLVDEILERERHELEDTKRALASMTSTLNDTDNQVRDMERQIYALRQQAERAKIAFERLQKHHHDLQDENRTLQTSRGKTLGFDDGTFKNYSRTSVDSARPSSRATSPKHAGSPTQTNIDLVYLKNVLLQFMELKDKNKQQQLIPALKMLLSLDKREEQKWLSLVAR